MFFSKGLVGFILVMVVCSQSFAQANDCEQVLNAATDEFNAGHFYGLPALLQPCIDKGFTREQRQRAYLLLTQTYLLLDDPVGAESSYLKLLKANPEFLTDPSRDPIDVVYLSKKFTAAPVVSIFGKIGSNVSPITVIRHNPVSGDGQVKESYNLKAGYQVNFGADWHYTERLSITGEIGYLSTAYLNVEKGVFNRDTKEALDRQSWLTIPLSVKYSDNVGNIRPYGYAGFSTDILLGDIINIKISNFSANTNDQEQTETNETSESADLNFRYKRNKLNYALFAGAGIKYKQGLNFFFLDFRYSLGLKNIVNYKALYGDASTTDKALEDMNPVTQWGHVDDYFRLNNFAITIGYVRPLYKPRKLKNVKTKSVLRNIKKNGKGEANE